MKDVICPVTALRFVTSESSTILLAGAGPFLKIFDHGTTQTLHIARVFESQAIHGIIATERHSGKDEVSTIELLVWGGRSVCTGELRDVTDRRSEFEISFGEEYKADDWILDACFKPDHNFIGINGALKESNAVLMTAHNAALTLHHGEAELPPLKPITAGPKSMLYSACAEWAAEGRILVASGTVFGEILFWSFSESALSSDVELPVIGQLHFRFTGHEGSVFGIRLSPKLSGEGFQDWERLLASCSDDRTIQVWDISGFEENDTQLDGFLDTEVPPIESKEKLPRNRCLATIMGHLSRIWDVHFLVSRNNIDILSLGEDSTAQVWQLVQDPAPQNLHMDKHEDLQLTHKQTFSYHSGKNIWASAILQNMDDSQIVCTGGADGQIVSYSIFSQGGALSGKVFRRSWTINDTDDQLKDNDTLATDRTDASAQKTETTLSEHIFDGFEGTWIINRNIRSALLTYPSGTFSGEATFKRRSPTTSGYDKECLYIEQGTFTADQGSSFAATRQYVYRYQQASDTISAWFAKPEDNSTVDYLFHEVRLDHASIMSNDRDAENGYVVRADGYHLCVDDHYTPQYTLCLNNSILQDWKLAYQVKGPQKDYVAEASYIKQSDDDHLITAQGSEQIASSIAQARKTRAHVPFSSPPSNDNFKSYVFLNQDSFLVTTAQGRVLRGSLEVSGKNNRPGDNKGAAGVTWEMVGQCKELVSSSMATRGLDLVLLSGNDGTVFLYDHLVKEIRPIAKLGRKVAFLYAHESRMEGLSIFATCVESPTGFSFPSGRTSHHLNIKAEDCHPLLLALPPSFIVTGALYIGTRGLWVLGSRGGALAFYDASKLTADRESQPNRVVHEVHGQDAIMVIECIPETSGNLILTAGRDGHYAVHDISCHYGPSSEKDPIYGFETIHRTTLSFGPHIEGAFFHPPDESALSHPSTRQNFKTQELVLWGFRSKNFVVWSASRNIEIMNIECGGAHRNWTYMPHKHARDGGTFIWTKASVCCIHSQCCPSGNFLQYLQSVGGHGREVKAMATTMLVRGAAVETYIATGSEDTAIRIWSKTGGELGSEDSFNCLGIFTKHTTGIQQLRWSDEGRFLFSAAGCEELFAWRVQPVPVIGVGTVCKAVCPKVTEDGDLRIMDFYVKEVERSYTKAVYIINVVYSDSSLRVSHLIPFRVPDIETSTQIFQFTDLHSNAYGINVSLDPQFTLLQSTTYTTNCLTQILALHSDPLDTSTPDYLCTASSDGHIAFWPFFQSSFFPVNQTNIQDPVSEGITMKYSHRHNLHQSSIKCMTTTQISTNVNEHLLLTGGDDGALGVTRLIMAKSRSSISDESGHRVPDEPVPTCSTLLIPKAHAAAINAVTFLSTTDHSQDIAYTQPNMNDNSGSDTRYIFATSGNDQKVKLWGISCNADIPGTEGLSVEVKGEKWTCVADVSALCSMRGNEVLVAGIGMESLRFGEEIGGNECGEGARER